MSCAEVCIGDMGYEGSSGDFACESTRLARRRHRCCECNREIDPGELYEHVAGKSDGGMFAEKTCAECAEIRKALVCGNFFYGMLWESIAEEVFPAWDRTGPWDCLAKIDSPAARQALTDSYAAYKAQ